MIEELKEYLQKADAQDLKECLLENFVEKDCPEHFLMLSEIYYNDKAHFNVLSDGCKAAMLIYLQLSAWSRRFQ